MSPMRWGPGAKAPPEATEKCPHCDGNGWTRCPVGCHGFGVCRECGDTGQVDCHLCSTTGRVTPEVLAFFGPKSRDSQEQGR
jgi:hypothetical protein